MEITFQGRLRRNEQLVRPDGTKKDTGETSAPRAQPQTDRVSSAQQAIRQAAEQLDAQSQRLAALVRQDQQAEKKPFIWDMLDGEEKDSEADALGEQMKTMERCHKIAARIMRGDKVPPQDERYLMMNDPDGYKLAMAMRKPKKHPKKHESVLKDEDKTAGSHDGGDGEDAVSSCEESGAVSDAGGDSAAGE